MYIQLDMKKKRQEEEERTGAAAGTGAGTGAAGTGAARTGAARTGARRRHRLAVEALAGRARFVQVEIDVEDGARAAGARLAVAPAVDPRRSAAAAAVQ